MSQLSTYKIRENSTINKFWSNIESKKKVNIDTFFMFDEDNEIDDRISVRGEKNFEHKLSILKNNLKNIKQFRIIIGVSRYNFFKVHEIANHYLKLIDKKPIVKDDFELFPLTNLKNRFNDYIQSTSLQLPSNIILEAYDPELNELLNKVQSLAIKKKTSGKKIARLMNVICEHVFIGPEIITLDIVRNCNTNCTHCRFYSPYVNQPDEFHEMKLSSKKFKAIVNDAAELQVDLVLLIGAGEPLLNNELFDMIKYIQGKGLKVGFFSNGILMNKKIAKQVIELGVDEVFFSVTAGSPEVYAKVNPMHKEKTYHLVKENIKNLVMMRNKLNKSYPKVKVTHVIHKQNHLDIINMAKDDAFENVDAARFFLIRPDKESECLILTPDEIDNIRLQLPEAKEILKRASIEFYPNIFFQLENYNPNDGSYCGDIYLNKGCVMGYLYNEFEANGKVHFCCHRRIVGNLEKKSYKDIWHSKEFRTWRRHAKFMSQHKDTKFLNNQVLYDDQCKVCEGHPIMNNVYDDLDMFGLMKYYK